ncbi:MAG: HD-GYP domain-containing protein [Candidatus Omnitrophica bacterium]|nr:HD-GYP domain-containing protein [Candidatus Omnitrophota bacterium]
MDLVIYILPIATFFIGSFIGYRIYRKEERLRHRRVWMRFERRNVMRTINSLVSAIDFKDKQTRNHSDNVRHYATAIAQEMGLSQAQIGTIKEACQVHDLGKIGVHDNILTKPGKLTESEFKEMKLHSLAGAVILKPFHFLDKVVLIVRQHHERYDGLGYPDGIKGDKIDIGARIMSVADSFDAMTSKRPYREPVSKEEALAELEAFSGTQFDPKVVEVFVKLMKVNDDLFKKAGESSDVL